MGKGRKHVKASKTAAAKKGGKNDQHRKKAKHTDPTSGIPRDSRATVEAMMSEIEREEVEAVETQPVQLKAPSKKTEKRLKAIERREGIEVKSGMTLKQAYGIADKIHNQPRLLKNIPAPDYDGSEDEESSQGDVEEEEDYSDTANERANEYRRGGYHPVVVGDIYNERYRIVKKLGWGYFSTVWLVWDYTEERYQAMKVQKSAKHYLEAAYDEIKLLSEIMQSDPHRSRHCARLNDHFEHTGPNGVHVCMVFDVYGENLLSLLERYEYRGIPLPIVKCISRQVLVALDHTASIGIIHTDLKPENVLLSTPKHAVISLMRHYHPLPLHQRPRLTEKDPKTMTKSQRRRYYKKLAKEKEAEAEAEAAEQQEQAAGGKKDDSGSVCSQNDQNSEVSKTDSEWEVERFHHVILADFGNSCWVDKQFTDEVQTRQYRCPEVILGEPYSTPIDIWSCACMIFELITGEFLFDPKKGGEYSRDEDHLALMTELLGDVPECMRLGDGKYRSNFYNSRGELRNIKDLHYWNLESVLHERYKFTQSKAKEISDFLIPMLEYIPEHRASAASMLRDFESFFEIKEDDYEPLCYDPRGEGSSASGGSGVDDGEDDEECEEEDDDDMDSYSSSSGEHPRPTRARPVADEERAEAFRFWEEHPILNRTSLEQRGLTIGDIQSVLAGKALDSADAQAAAVEVIRLLSEETERLSSDGHEADVDGSNECDSEDDATTSSDEP